MTEPSQDWKDANRLIYEDMMQWKRSALQLSGDYGKWLIASLLLIHGAAIVFLAQSEPLAKTILPIVYWWHIAGIVLALVCGFAVWINWSLHVYVYEGINPHMIYNPELWPNLDSPAGNWIPRTHWIAIVSGMLSGLSILGAAIMAHSHLSGAAPV